jgi:hypothetical protein
MLLLLAGCAPTLRELGDEPMEEATAGSGGGNGVIPQGNVSHGGAMQGSLLPEGGATTEPSTSEGGATMDPVPSMGGAAPTDCFSPTQQPELSQDSEASGCPCGPGDGPTCIGTRYLAPNLELSFECVDGAWAVVEEGACDGGAGCQTDDGIYASGAQNVPDPYSCNTCSCIDGVITNCTEIGCPKACPDNSMPALGCLDCVEGDCRLSHYACFTSIYVDCNEYGCFAQSACGDQLP